ncbi:FAD-dependent monooxygenase [Pseudaminobacter sp. NGMCC 1.201702]|uniref:FAD-dependent monooxygenase n=1 Tax=Pseudaminobacter sp. NGMCC 1.201702 TaxID=3391825 RepID=UPI0039EE6325
MDKARSGQIIIAGAGIAGLTAALAFASRGFSVEIFERSATLQEVGAGLQLSPNATRILDRLGVLEGLSAKAVRPRSVVLRDARSLNELAHVPLGEMAEQRWGAPYLVAHRADLQAALLDAVSRQLAIRLTTGATVRNATPGNGCVCVNVDIDSEGEQMAGSLLIGADGVWSGLRGLAGGHRQSRFSGEIAWRLLVQRDSIHGRRLAELGATDAVIAFLHPGFHLITYPVRGGGAFNLVAFTRGRRIVDDWSAKADTSELRAALRGTAPALKSLGESEAPWTAWPVHTVDATTSWTSPGLALIGDAAHAMTPFAAQGAAMAIEDAETLAHFVATSKAGSSASLAAWEAWRRPRIRQVARRGAFNHFAWHAAGPVAMARNLVLRTRRPEALAADLDWLYGWEPSL